MYSGEYNACDVNLSVYPHWASLKNMPDHGGNRTYDLWNTSPMLCQLSYAVWSVRVCDISEQNLVPSISMLSNNNHDFTNRPDRVAQLAEHWASIPKVVGSIPTVVRHIFQACPVWIYTQSNITSRIDNILIEMRLKVGKLLKPRIKHTPRKLYFFKSAPACIRPLSLKNEKMTA